MVHVLRTLLKKTPSEAMLLDNYATVCLALDEMIFEVPGACVLLGEPALYSPLTPWLSCRASWNPLTELRHWLEACCL